MSLDKVFKDDSFLPSVASFFDDFFGKEYYSGLAKGTMVPAINISEDESGYNLDVAAPGMQKEDFNVDLEGNMIIISSEKKEEKELKQKKITRKEFSYSSFKRIFTLPENVVTDEITANYDKGILNVWIPKEKNSTKASTRKITIK